MRDNGKWCRRAGSVIHLSQHLPPPRPEQGRPTLRSPWRGPERLQTEPRQPSNLQVESSNMVQIIPRERCSRPRLCARRLTAGSLPGASCAFDTFVGFPDDDRVYHLQIQNRWERGHLNLHIHLSVDEAAAGTLCTPWCERLLDHGIRLHELTTRERVLFLILTWRGRDTPEWPEPHGITTCQLSAGHLPLNCQLRNYRATNPRAGAHQLEQVAVFF